MNEPTNSKYINFRIVKAKITSKRTEAGIVYQSKARFFVPDPADAALFDSVMEVMQDGTSDAKKDFFAKPIILRFNREFAESSE